MEHGFIIHGAYGNPGENWFPWLKDEIEKLDIKAYVPKFPTPENQSLGSWMKVFGGYKDLVDEDTVFVGHSLGPAFILSILEKLDRPVKACYFVSGFLGDLGNPDFDSINKSFTTKRFDWEKIKRNCGEFYLYHSDDDPYVPLEKAKYLAQKLGVKVKVIKGAGHFNASAGYYKFEVLLNDIKLNI